MGKGTVTSWKYYNHAMIPNCAPHEVPDMKPVEDGSVWRGGGYFARWTTDFDCGEETGFWYCIKDDVFDIQSLKSKRRYEIVKGKRNFSCQRIEAEKYSSEIADILAEAAGQYPDKYRQDVDREAVLQMIPEWDRRYLVYGAFDEKGRLCGYAYLERYDSYSEFRVLKVYPACERKGINAALTACILEDYREVLEQGHYICDGTRPIQHETNFQDYLAKYFGFRKAYCRLHIKYRWYVKGVINMLYIFRKKIEKYSSHGLLYKITGVLRMEEIVRNSDKELQDNQEN